MAVTIGPPKKRANRYNPQYAAIQRRLKRGSAQAKSDRNMQLGRLGQDYRSNLSQLNEAKTEANKYNTASMADQGILRSGINVAQKQKIGSTYMKDLNNLQQSRTRANEDVERGYTSRQQELADIREEAEIQNTREQAEYAKAEAYETALGRSRQTQLEARERQLARQRRKMQPKKSATGKYKPGNYQIKVPKGETRKRLDGKKRRKRSYKVKSGDNLGAIARRLGVPAKSLRKRNKPRSGDWNLIYPGERFLF